jgi:hypothetical protein
MDISERKRGDRQKLARLIARESNAMQRDRLRSVLLVLQGRRPRLSPEQETRFVQRVKAGATPRDGVASLRGRQIQGILDREFGKTFPSMGSTSCSSGMDSFASSPGQGIHGRTRLQRRPSSGAPPFCESRAGLTASHEGSPVVPGRDEIRPTGHSDGCLGDQGIAANRRASERPQVDLGIRGRRAGPRRGSRQEPPDASPENIRWICRTRWITPED